MSRQINTFKLTNAFESRMKVYKLNSQIIAQLEQTRGLQCDYLKLSKKAPLARVKRISFSPQELRGCERTNLDRS